MRGSYSTPQPHHYYEFHTSILFANKKIYQEAAYIFYNENLFTYLSFYDERDITDRGFLSGFIERCGVPIVARERHARAFRHHSMELYIGCADQDQKPIVRTGFIVAGDDLSLLCKSYAKLYLHMGYGMYLQKVRIEVLEGKSRVPSKNLRGAYKPAAYGRRLLEPFRRLHSHTSVQINGAISAKYKSEILFEMMKAPQTADDLLHTMTFAQHQAEEQTYHGKLELACKTYQTVIEDVEIGFEWPPTSGYPFRCHEQPASKCENAICLAEFNVRIQLSKICLTLQRPDQVRKWTNSALTMLRVHDIVTDTGEKKILQAKLFYQLAWASHQMEVHCRARDEIWRAVRLDPGYDVYKRIQQDWLEEEAQQPHVHGGKYPEACEDFWDRQSA